MILDIGLLFGLTFLSWLVYLNGINGEFVFDDFGILQALEKQPKEKVFGPRPLPLGIIRSTIDRMIRQHRSLLYATYRRDFSIHGKEQRRGWHATNLNLHSMNVCLVYGLLRAFFPPFSAAIGASLFAVFPLATSSAQMIYGRSSLLCGVFYISGLICALIGGPAWVLVPCFFYYGWLSKQEILMLPVAMALTLWIIR